jgi:large subunit ribosomal protein L4
VADKLTAPLYSSDGKSKGDVTLEAAVFGIEPNVPVMHQVVTAQLAAARAGTHNTKTRAEVRGGGRKPWRQKGLGRARHGSIRSPSWTGGGVAHGPKPRDYSQRTPKKMKRLALRSALSTRAADGRVRVVEGFDWDTPRTKRAVDLLAAMDTGTKVLVVLDRSDDVAYRSMRNLENVVVNSQLNPYDVLWADTVVFTADTLASASGVSDYSVSEEDFVKEDAARDPKPAARQSAVVEAAEEPVADSEGEAGRGEPEAADDSNPAEVTAEESS